MLLPEVATPPLRGPATGMGTFLQKVTVSSLIGESLLYIHPLNPEWCLHGKKRSA